MIYWLGPLCFETGIDMGLWEVSISLFFRMKVASVQVGPFYAQVSW
jgi:hypothetical protein